MSQQSVYFDERQLIHHSGTVTARILQGIHMSLRPELMDLLALKTDSTGSEEHPTLLSILLLLMEHRNGNKGKYMRLLSFLLRTVH